MSRIGKKPILIPENVKVEIGDSIVKVEGKKGKLSQEIPEGILVEKKEKELVISPERRTKKSMALWGMIRSILQNAVIGVESGFEKRLEIRGVGYKASLPQNKLLRLEVGFSHPIEMEIPESLEVSVEKNIIIISGADKQKVGQFAAEIRRVRPPEPYKGKGIRYVGEKVRMKQKKKAVGAAE